MPYYKQRPPSYHPGSRHHHEHSKSHRVSNPAYSYYPDEEILHFYRWKSPPGVMKIISIIIIILCVAIFACVASTLAWDYDYDMLGLGGGIGTGAGGLGGIGAGGYGGGFGGSGSSYGGSSYGGSSYGGYTQTSPEAGKGFMLALAAISFIVVLIVFVLVVSRQSTSRSPKFYLAVIILSAILALLMAIATIVYMVAVNPMAQSTGSIYYSSIIQICSQYQNQNQAAQGVFINQYLYHYCVVEPQEALAMVMGFLVAIGLIILLVFAVKTRQKILRWGPDRILWENMKLVSNGLRTHTIGEWVNNVSGEPNAMLNDYNSKVGGSRDLLDKPPEYSSKPLYLPGSSDITSSLGGLKSKMRDNDIESGGEDLDESDFDLEFPTILDERERLDYKREFDRDHAEYKELQADLDDINQGLVEVDKELDRQPEGSPQFLDAMDEYTRLKNLKKSADYQVKKKRCKHLKAKLSHIKRRVSEYDRRR